jgi:hypothetical protein
MGVGEYSGIGTYDDTQGWILKWVIEEKPK